MKRVIPLSIVLFLLVFIPSAFAQSGHIKLVTAIDEGTTTRVGGTPDLYLDVRPGNGNIYIDSIPLTKIDTQISARFANAVACDFLEYDCSKYDFFYRIRADSNLVGGPSAGASITVLTIAVLDGQKLDEGVIMTGTINSGGLVGPVGGINEKAISAENSGLKKFLIPKLGISNLTSLQNLSENVSIDIIPVANIEEALFYYTGKNYSKDLPELAVPEQYTKTMKSVADKLCQRFKELKDKMDAGMLEETNSSLYNNAMGFYNKSLGAGEKGDYYSQASYCFTGNLRLRELSLQDYSNEKLEEGYNGTAKQIGKFEEKVDSISLKTLSDLETYMIVKERIVESKSILDEINTSNISSAMLAYSYERLYSGVYWSDFFELKGEQFALENDQLRDSCFNKINEAKERIDYISVYFNYASSLNRLTDDLMIAYGYFEDEDYALCIFKASKVKADADSLLTLLFVDENQVENILEQKIEHTKKVLAQQQEKGMFPILGYSYYEYAQSLKESDIYSSLLYLEYAIELSKLDMYFPPKKPFSFGILNSENVRMFLLGALFGFLATMFVVMLKKDIKKYKQKKYGQKKTAESPKKKKKSLKKK